MPKKQEHPLTFLTGHVQSKDVLRTVATIDELSEVGANRTWLMKWTKADGKWGRFVVTWQVSRMWVRHSNGAHVFATGTDGHLALLTPTGSGEEWIDDSESGVISRGPIRDIRGIGMSLFAFGMGRQVYRRGANPPWSHFDDGALLPRGTVRVAGFNGLDGLSEIDLFAVGFGGEIWRRNTKVWRQLQSPTNAILYGVRVVGEQLAYAGGQKGVLLRGIGDDWEIIPQTATKDDIWSLEWFDGRLYAATADSIYRLEDDELEEVKIKAVNTFGHLHANDGVMLSVGTKDVVWTSDAKKWNDITP
jgi:hypothetical protein